jgi:hypothetical protein
MVEGAVDSSGEDSDGGYSRFEESSKWVAEMGEQLVEAESSVTSSEDFMKGALATLDMLDEKVERVDVRLGQIEIRMKGLEERGKEAEIMKKEDEPSKKRKVREESNHGIRRSERLRPKRAGGSQLGKGVLMQSILGMFMPHWVGEEDREWASRGAAGGAKGSGRGVGAGRKHGPRCGAFEDEGN